MKTIIITLTFTLLAFLLSLVLTPFLKKIAIKSKLVDIPNHRKIHTNPIPLIGGLTIGIIIFILTLGAFPLFDYNSKYISIIGCAYILLIVGVIDDKKDIRAIYKLLLQLILAALIALNGTRLTSLFGLFGIFELNIYWQYILTILIITAVVNAFNFMDGIDGLVGSLSIFCFFLLLVIGLVSKNDMLIKFSGTIIGSLIAFIRNNLSSDKIFMGDAGSLFLSFILICIGIETLESFGTNTTNQSYVLAVIITLFSIPILDSIRVYLTRLKKGYSPLVADKSHIHHLLLNTGLSHIKISTIIILLAFLILICSLGFVKITNTNYAILAIATIFLFFIKATLIVSKLKYWQKKIKMLEQKN